ncbi:chemotaxis protein CheB [Paraburkholderia sp. RCC_158]|uniref:chemotaxis protein CheB n=1 Tax=Paraburkholderia sp. RCC_158 TaxID=3239220 RepID=UPI0035239CE7
MANRNIVAIGASTGGLDALSTLVSGLAQDFPAALLIVLHTAPSSPRLLAAIVSRSTSLPVRYAEDGDTLENGCIFIAPPDCHMIVRDPCHLGSDCGPKVQFVRPSIDKLFESVAQVFGIGAIGVVLSGRAHAGSNGLSAITAAGGVGIVQDPLDARAAEMPASAIAGGHPKFVLPVVQIASLLSRLVQEEIDS